MKEAVKEPWRIMLLRVCGVGSLRVHYQHSIHAIITNHDFAYNNNSKSFDSLC